MPTFTIDIPMENITTTDLVEELTKRGDMNEPNLSLLLETIHKLYFPDNIGLCPGCFGPCGACELDKWQLVHYPFGHKKAVNQEEALREISTADLSQEFFTRDDCDEHFDPHYLHHFIDNPEKIPVCYLVLKAENLHDQQVLADLKETFKMMTV